ncbi:MAG: hypothetical protein JWR90_987 [Marmoricola sp.]|jgi:hypothetical protein|nr:hypothetical protein [Marmoricola sp.]
MIPVVAPPLGASSQEDGEVDRRVRAERVRAPSSGARNAYNLVMHERATWREAVLGSAFLLGLVTAAGSAAAGVLAVRRWRRSKVR